MNMPTYYISVLLVLAVAAADPSSGESGDDLMKEIIKCAKENGVEITTLTEKEMWASNVTLGCTVVKTKCVENNKVNAGNCAAVAVLQNQDDGEKLQKCINDPSKSVTGPLKIGQCFAEISSLKEDIE